MDFKIKLLIIFGLLGLSVAMFPGRNACATGQIAPQTCDTKVWEAMESRAILETEREVMQNQNLIYKADSVLSYTCFDSFVSHASANIGPLFTHTTYFNGQEIIPWGAPYGMDRALQNVVINSMASYIDKNFQHKFLGGRGEKIPSLSGLVATPNNINGKGESYNCTTMNQVWTVAKCLNFMHNDDFAKTDGFYPFTTLTALTGNPVKGYDDAEKKDVRKFPSACGSEDPVSGGWADMYRKSRNETNFGSVDRLYPYGRPLNDAFTKVRQKVEPGSCGTPATAIKTGVKVILSTATSAGDVYDDGVCTNPGCSYTKAGTCTLATGG